VASANNEPGNYRTLGVLWLLYGVFRIIGGVWLLIYSPVLTLMWGALLNRVPNPFGWMDLFHVYLVLAIILAAISTIISLLAGATLLTGARSARTLALIAAFLAIISDPLGVALGVFTIVIVFPRTSTQSN
jgi:hypothetical protein